MITGRFRPRDTELVNAATSVSSLATHGLVDFGRLQIEFLRRCGRGFRGSSGRGHGVMNRLRELRGIAVPADMHVHHTRGLVQHMIVHGGHFQPAFLDLCHHRSNFVLG